MERSGFKKEEKMRMLLSKETLTGLRMTGSVILNGTYAFLYLIFPFCVLHSFIELVQYVFSPPGIKENGIALLSQNLCQDPLENYFGC